MVPEPEIFVLLSDEGARGNKVGRPGTTVNQVNAQFSGMKAVSLPKCREMAITAALFQSEDFSQVKK